MVSQHFLKKKGSSELLILCAALSLLDESPELFNFAPC